MHAVMEKDYLENNLGIDDLERDFLRGDLSKLKCRICPICQSQRCLRYSVAKQPPEVGPPGRRIRAGISIYCEGTCNYMISHMEGFCPAWAEQISDWNSFTAQMNDP